MADTFACVTAAGRSTWEFLSPIVAVAASALCSSLQVNSMQLVGTEGKDVKVGINAPFWIVHPLDAACLLVAILMLDSVTI